MNLEEALALRARALSELKRAHALDKERRTAGQWEYHQDFDSLPHCENVWVITDDGERFGILWFTGEYDGYSEDMAWSVEEWQRENMAWFQTYFNPQGGWKERTVVEVNSDARSRHFDHALLHCGHEELVYVYDSAPPRVGDKRVCITCRDTGVGYVRGMSLDVVESQ